MVDSADVEAQLQRILRSPSFAGSPRSAQFLSFCVVRGSGAGAIDLKETTIAVEVFNRPPDYDPKLDPIVRVHARRVREKLELYYRTLGNDDPVRIDLPKGGYIPRFSRTLPNRKTDFSDWIEPQDNQEQTSIDEAPTAAARPRRSRTLVGFWLFCGVLAIALVALVRLSFHRAVSAAEPVGPPKPLNLPGRVFDPAWSPDGARLTFTSVDAAGKSHIYVTHPGDAAPAERVTHEEATEMKSVWSPDGKRIAFLKQLDLSTFEIVCLRTKDGAVQSFGPFHTGIYVNQEHAALDWSTDGKYLLTTEQVSSSSPMRLVLVSTENGERTALTAPPTGSTGDIEGKFSPDGKWVAFRRGGLGDLYVVSSKGEAQSPAAQLTYTMRGVRGIAWSPDSESIFFGTHDDTVDRMGVWQIPRTGGTPRQVTPVGFDAVSPAVSRGRSFVFTRLTLVTTLVMHSLTEKIPDRPMFASSAIDKGPALSPNGKLVAFASDRSGAEQLWIGKIGDATPRQVTHFTTQGHVFFPSWSPNGRLVAFSLRDGAATNIFLYDVASDRLRQVTATRNRNITPAFSPNGDYLYYSSNDDGTSRLWRVRTDGSARAEPMFWEAVTGYVPSSDGKWMYFVDSGSTMSLVRRSLQDGTSETIFRTTGSPTFAKDLAIAGRYVYMAVSTTDGTQADLHRIDPDSGTSKVIAHLTGIPSAEISGFSISADGGSLLTSQMKRDDSTLYAQTLR